MNCDIIRDLLPSFAEGLTSEASNEAVRQHFEECESCRNYYEKMSRENVPVFESAGRQVDYFLRIREATIRKIIIAVAVVTLLFPGIYAAYQNIYMLGRSAESDEVALSVQQWGDGCALVFDAAEDGYVMNVGYTEGVTVDGAEPVFTLHVVKYRQNPFDKEERYFEHVTAYPYSFSGENCFIAGYQSHWFDQDRLYYDEDDFIAIEFMDCIKTITLADLRAGDLSSLR